MAFIFGSNSRARLASVHADLRRVAERAIQISDVDFAVTQGNRTPDDQARLFGKGRTAAQCRAASVPVEYAQPTAARVTWTLNSNHIGGRAIDIVPYVDGAICWDDDGKRGLWPKLASAMKRAAAELGVPIQWGGDWKSSVDRPHFELAKGHKP